MDDWLRLRIGVQLKERIKKASSNMGMSVAAFVRMSVIEKLKSIGDEE